ncbi:hypothetical protein X744_21115 [Mesorhizobium sp. LNJC372A00]|nr:hypothetical protein X745_23870 [Mesorhizobium sp. LNJC374B00]ESY56846.1 hypothetical protein X744_21115 [Mesorhizobium sp. LNJC372A00]
MPLFHDVKVPVVGSQPKETMTPIACGKNLSRGSV